MKKRTLINRAVRVATVIPMCLVAFSLVPVPMLAESTATALTVHIKDGSEVTFLLSEQPAVTFSDGYLLITSSDAEMSYPLSDVVKFTFKDADETTGIDNTSVGEASFAFDGGSVVVSGLKAGSNARVFATDGTTLHSEEVSGDSWSYSLSSLPSGVYIVSINGKTFKIAKK